MAIRDYNEDVVVVSDKGRSNTASNAIWAVALVVITMIIVGALYYSGLGSKMFRSAEKKVDINVTVPSR